VTLIVAGASIDLAHLSAYCRDHPDDSSGEPVIVSAAP
jgi:hypothetical protein